MTKKAIKRRKDRALLRAAKQQAGLAVQTQPNRNQQKRANKGAGPSTDANTRVAEGSDVLGVVTITKHDKVGASLLRFVVNPRSLPRTRLGMQSQLWQRWTPVSLRLRIVSAAGMMIPGAYIAAWFSDPKQALLDDGPTNVAKCVTCRCYVQKPVGQGATLSIPSQTSRKWYAFEGEDFDDSHGVVVLAVAGVSGGTEITLTVSLDWKIKFNGPTMPAEAGGDTYIQPEAGWENVFTDSTSDWAEGKRLTFKHAEGGAVVPWEGISTGLYYEPTAGVKILYKTSSGSEAECKWFSCMINEPSYNAALVCHASKEDAVDYQKTGNVNKVLPYYAAGSWVVPPSPVLKGTPIVGAKLDLSPGSSQGPAMPKDRPRSEDQPVAVPAPASVAALDMEALAKRVAAIMLEQMASGDNQPGN